jgi:predicted nuclease of predicted toxin-antitoxin system
VIRLLLDEMIGAKIADQLRTRGYDVYSVVEHVELRSMPDADVLEMATLEDRVLVTLNIVDFQILDRAWASQGRIHGGIVFISTAKYRQSRSFVGLVVTALDHAAKEGQLPHPGSSIFL